MVLPADPETVMPLWQPQAVLPYRAGNSSHHNVLLMICAYDGRVAEVESASPQRSVRLTDDSRGARGNHRQADVDDLFAQWASDPLQLLSFPDLGM
ncbi:MAG: hypothetical protein ACYC3X_16635 [Pirellulaceae bacterium]